MSHSQTEPLLTFNHAFMSRLGQCSLRSVAFLKIWLLSPIVSLCRRARYELCLRECTVRQAVGYYTSKRFTNKDLAIQQPIKICIRNR